MPDISVLIELADYYDVDLREILNFVRVLQLSGKMDRKSHSKVIIASLIFSGTLFVLRIAAVLYGCGIIG